MTDCIAIGIYWPFSRLAKIINLIGFNDSSIPLSFYKNSSLYTLRTDALDRLGTKLEKRYSKSSIIKLMHDCGLTNIKFSDEVPYWVAVGYKA